MVNGTVVTNASINGSLSDFANGSVLNQSQI